MRKDVSPLGTKVDRCPGPTYVHRDGPRYGCDVRIHQRHRHHGLVPGHRRKVNQFVDGVLAPGLDDSVHVARRPAEGDEPQVAQLSLDGG